jgi:hypothetical protein
MAAAEAYFVGRSELLTWINSTLGLRINKVEEVRICLIERRCCIRAAQPSRHAHELLCLQHTMHLSFLFWLCRLQMGLWLAS